MKVFALLFGVGALMIAGAARASTQTAPPPPPPAGGGGPTPDPPGSTEARAQYQASMAKLRTALQSPVSGRLVVKIFFLRMYGYKNYNRTLTKAAGDLNMTVDTAKKMIPQATYNVMFSGGYERWVDLLDGGTYKGAADKNERFFNYGGRALIEAGIAAVAGKWNAGDDYKGSYYGVQLSNLAPDFYVQVGAFVTQVMQTKSQSDLAGVPKPFFPTFGLRARYPPNNRDFRSWVSAVKTTMLQMGYAPSDLPKVERG